LLLLVSAYGEPVTAVVLCMNSCVRSRLVAALQCK